MGECIDYISEYLEVEVQHVASEVLLADEMLKKEEEVGIILAYIFELDKTLGDKCGRLHVEARLED